MYQRLQRRLFSSPALKRIQEGTVPHILKSRLLSNRNIDVVRFDRSKQLWTVQQIDSYSSAFAYGLLENGFSVGDKLVVWLDQAHSAEIATAYLGAMKAGVSIVAYFSDGSNDTAKLAEVLSSTQARGLLFSPYASVQGGESKRIETLYDIAPSLESYHPGQPVILDQFPHLKNIIQVSHNTIRGTIKFKQHLFYASPIYTNLRLPTVSPSQLALESFFDSNQKSSFTNEQLVSEAEKFYDSRERAVLVSASINSPGGFIAGILSPLLRGHFSYFPQVTNLSEVYKALQLQEASTFVCQKELYEINPPEKKRELYFERTKNVEEVVVLSNDGQKPSQASEALEKMQLRVIDPFKIASI